MSALSFSLNPNLSIKASVSTPTKTSLYQVLRIEKTASQMEIKTAYRRLAKLYHPDAKSDGHQFIHIHNAYQTLSDPASRALYDFKLSAVTAFYPTRRWETDQCW